MSIIMSIHMTKEDKEIGKWLSAALEDSSICGEMKADIKNWFVSFEKVIEKDHERFDINNIIKENKDLKQRLENAGSIWEACIKENKKRDERQEKLDTKLNKLQEFISNELKGDQK